jgi:hypothetical protein
MELARLGAAARIREHEAEIAKLRRILIHQPSARASAAAVKTASSGSPQARKRRKKMSAAQKRAISLRMKKYWAAKRKEKGQ